MCSSLLSCLLFLQSVGPLPTDRLLKGHYLDVIDEEVPTQAWIACIIENYGGRLKLRYSGAKEPDDFYLFYLSYRLHPPGWAKEHRVIIKPPKCKSYLVFFRCWFWKVCANQTGYNDVSFILV